jgi:thioredoxin reductase (NADPH)
VRCAAWLPGRTSLARAAAALLVLPLPQLLRLLGNSICPAPSLRAAGIRIRDRHTGHLSDLPVNGLFFAIGHAPATAFLEGQLELDGGGYIVTAPDSTATSLPGVFAAGDVMDRKWRQAVTSAGAGARSLPPSTPLCRPARLPTALLPLHVPPRAPPPHPLSCPPATPPPPAAAGCVAAIEAQHFLQSRQDSAPSASAVLGAQDLNAAWVHRVRAERQACEGDQVGGGRRASSVGWSPRTLPAFPSGFGGKLLTACCAGCAAHPRLAPQRMRPGSSPGGLAAGEGFPSQHEHVSPPGKLRSSHASLVGLRLERLGLMSSLAFYSCPPCCDSGAVAHDAPARSRPLAKRILMHIELPQCNK